MTNLSNVGGPSFKPPAVAEADIHSISRFFLTATCEQKTNVKKTNILMRISAY